MRALSIRQPWAWFIANGFKDIENRDWPTRFRGPVLIHASKWWNAEDIADDFRFCRAIAEAQGHLVPSMTLGEVRAQCGGIVGQATVTGCTEQSDSPWFFGRYGFVIADAKAIPFRPLKGALGFFTVPEAAQGIVETPLGGDAGGPTMEGKAT